MQGKSYLAILGKILDIRHWEKKNGTIFFCKSTKIYVSVQSQKIQKCIKFLDTDIILRDDPRSDPSGINIDQLSLNSFSRIPDEPKDTSDIGDKRYFTGRRGGFKLKILKSNKNMTVPPTPKIMTDRMNKTDIDLISENQSPRFGVCETLGNQSVISNKLTNRNINTVNQNSPINLFYDDFNDNSNTDIISTSRVGTFTPIENSEHKIVSNKENELTQKN